MGFDTGCEKAVVRALSLSRTRYLHKLCAFFLVVVLDVCRYCIFFFDPPDRSQGLFLGTLLSGHAYCKDDKDVYVQDYNVVRVSVFVRVSVCTGV